MVYWLNTGPKSMGRPEMPKLSARSIIASAEPDWHGHSLRDLASLARVKPYLATPLEDGFTLRDLLMTLHRWDGFRRQRRPRTGNGPMFRGPPDSPAPDFPPPVTPTF
jgi:hypothetical protein